MVEPNLPAAGAAPPLVKEGPGDFHSRVDPDLFGGPISEISHTYQTPPEQIFIGMPLASPCRSSEGYFVAITISRYSLGTTSEFGPPTFKRSSSAVMSSVKLACRAGSSAAYTLWVGP